MGLVKKISRKFLYPSLLAMGADRILRASARGKRLVLMYHGVTSTDSTWLSPRHLEVKQFERQIKYISENFKVVRASELIAEKLNYSKSDKPTVAITFDDGYLNNLELALPILEKYNLPATFFISTVCTIEQEQVLWADCVTILERVSGVKEFEIGGKKYSNGINEFGEHLFDTIKKMAPSSRDHFISEVSSKYGLSQTLKSLDYQLWKMMNKEDLQKFAAHPLVEIGSHGHMHYNLGDIPIDLALSDVSISKRNLENILQKEIDMIAYPDGSYTNEVIDSISSIGLKKQFAVSYRSTDDYKKNEIINRFGISSTTTYEANIILINRAFSKIGF